MGTCYPGYERYVDEDFDVFFFEFYDGFSVKTLLHFNFICSVLAAGPPARDIKAEIFWCFFDFLLSYISSLNKK